MNNGVTINVPEIAWPFVILVLAIIIMWRTGWLWSGRPVAKPRRSGKPKKAAPKRQPRQATTTFRSSRTGDQVRVTADNHRPQNLNDIR